MLAILLLLSLKSSHHSVIRFGSVAHLHLCCSSHQQDRAESSPIFGIDLKSAQCRHSLFELAHKRGTFTKWIYYYRCNIEPSCVTESEIYIFLSVLEMNFFLLKLKFQYISSELLWQVHLEELKMCVTNTMHKITQGLNAVQ